MDIFDTDCIRKSSSSPFDTFYLGFKRGLRKSLFEPLAYLTSVSWPNLLIQDKSYNYLFSFSICREETNLCSFSSIHPKLDYNREYLWEILSLKVKQQLEFRRLDIRYSSSHSQGSLQQLFNIKIIFMSLQIMITQIKGRELIVIF